MNDLLNQQLCDELREVINETDIFAEDEEESKKFLLICALMDRFDTAVQYINDHQKRPNSEAELIIFMAYSCIIKDGIDYIKNALKIGKSEDKKFLKTFTEKIQLTFWKMKNLMMISFSLILDHYYLHIHYLQINLFQNTRREKYSIHHIF